MEEQAYEVCKVNGCGNRCYIETDLYYRNGQVIDVSDLQASCSIAGAITRPGCLLYQRAYNNLPYNRPNRDDDDEGDFWNLVD
jgi:hypothetical protein